MLIFAVSLICALMLGAVYFLAYGAVAESVIIGFLLFVALDTGQRSLLNKRFPFSVKTKSRTPEREGEFTGKVSPASQVKESKPKKGKKPKTKAKKTKAKKVVKGKTPVKKAIAKAKKPSKKAVKKAKKVAKKPAAKKTAKKTAKKKTSKTKKSNN